MAIVKDTPKWSKDGKTLSNILIKDTNEYGTYNVVTTWYDGTPMLDSKLDSDLVYVKYEGKYLRQNLKEGQILQKDTVAQMRSLSSLEILLLKMGVYKHVQLNGYYTKGDTPAPIDYYLSTTTDSDDGGSVFEVGSIKLEHKFINRVDIKYYGASSTNVDNILNIQKCLDYVDGKGLEVIIPDSGGDFLVSGTLYVGSKTTMTWLGSFIKLSNYTAIGTVIANKFSKNAGYITLNNPLIDGSDITAGGTGDNGFSAFNTKHIRVYGGVIKNCKKGTEAFKLGGKAFQFESSNVEDVVVDGTRVENCSWAMSTQYDIQENNDLGGTKVEVKFNNIYALDCENLAILHQINGLVESDNHIVELNNITSVNCGNSDGLLILSRLKNAKINGITAIGSAITGGLIRGRHTNCDFKNIKVLQNMDSLILNKPSFDGQSVEVSQNNTYEFFLDSNINYVLSSSTDDEFSNRELRRSNINIKSSRDNFNFSLPQAAFSDTFISVESVNKKILISTMDAILNDTNNISKFNQSICLGTSRKIKTGIDTPNGNILGSQGDIYLREVNNYTNIYFKYFGKDTDTGWSLLAPLLSGDSSSRPAVATIGVQYLDTTIGKPIWWNGSGWVDSSGTTV